MLRACSFYFYFLLNSTSEADGRDEGEVEVPEWHKTGGAMRQVGCVCGQETEETDSETYGRCAVGELESIRRSENPADPLMEGGNMGECGAAVPRRGRGRGGASIPGPRPQAHTHREADAQMRDILQRWRPEERVRKKERAVSCSV